MVRVPAEFVDRFPRATEVELIKVKTIIERVEL